MFYRLFRLLAGVMLRLFFRRIEVEGRAAVPAAGPVLFVANHTNALVDPLFLVVTLKRRVTLTAKNVLGKNPLLGLLLRGLGAVTFHRRQDVGKGADRRQNLEALRRCREILARGGAVCIFPEGISHSDPHLRPFQSGAAHIALDFVDESSDLANFQIVPVGLLYTDKDRFRSAVCLRYGDALDVGQWHKLQPNATSHDLTDEIRRRVEAITLNYETRREILILTWGAEIVATQGVAPPPLGWKERPIAQWFALLRRLQQGYRILQESRPAEIEAVTQHVRRYRSELKRLTIDPGEVYLPIHWAKAMFFVVRELELLVIGAPLALYGAVNHLTPYLLVKTIAQCISKDKDHWATNVIYPSLLIFPLFYLLQIGAAWFFLPMGWATLYTLSLPYSAAVAILYGDRLRASWRRFKTFLYLWRHPERQRELADEGQAIIAAIRQLGEQIAT
jgi:glycerol-3-phosphate O-acyltransferase / dihydroxyacetone phosphate acyltransferase